MDTKKYINKLTSDIGFIKGFTERNLVNNLHRSDIIIKIKELQDLIEKTDSEDMNK